MTAKLDSEARRRIILDRYSKFSCTRTSKEVAEFRQGFHVPEQSSTSRARECALILGLLKVPVSEAPYFNTRPSGSSAKKGPPQPRAAGPRFTRTCLSPHDLAICEGVFDQVCGDEHIDPLSRDAEALAVAIVAIIRNITANERETAGRSRSLRRSKGAEKAHQLGGVRRRIVLAPRWQADLASVLPIDARQSVATALCEGDGNELGPRLI
ncbi:hypothetical protein NKH73_10350 [Mesorhizobium sp. M0938]|uniref:hypothetical protein n=1 Tax=unclassified Mesorhizobium TaxID=325217 RepID=UPI003336AB23